jgi:hypothetical protein
MRSAIVLLERSSVVPKHVWRDALFRRTLLPIEVTPLITGAWKSNQPVGAEQGSIVMSLKPDGSAKDAQTVHTIQGQQKDFIGAFDVSFTSPDRVRVTLREDDCALHAGSPGAPHPSDRSASTMETHSCSTERAIRGPLRTILSFAGISSGALRRSHARLPGADATH